MVHSVARGDTLDDELSMAAEHGRICALATRCFRDLRECASEYPALFPAEPFDPTVFSGVALAMAFGASQDDTGLLRMTARTVMWTFALDWLIDHVATSREEIDAIAGGCEAVAGGAAPGGPLEILLARLRDELAAGRHWAELRPVWREALHRYLAANVREWDWKAAYAAGDRTALPTFEEYLGNADNLGFTFVNVTHWIRGGVSTVAGLRRLTEVSGPAQSALRLVNDLASYERDVSSGDLNSLMLGVTREGVSRRAAEFGEAFGALAGPLSLELPDEVAYLRRQLGFSTGYWEVTDYWGAR
jgi:hypothetical protein